MAGRQKCWKINTATIELVEKILHNAAYAAKIEMLAGRKNHYI
jgi:hypothetical protein